MVIQKVIPMTGSIGRVYSFAVILFIVCGLQAEIVNSGRKPLENAVEMELKYKPTGTRFRADTATKQLVEYAVNGKIQYDQRTHIYLLEWVGTDGKIKNVAWAPPNKVNAIVAGAVHYNTDSHLFEYSYEVASLQKSRQKLQSFYVTSGSEVTGGLSPNATWYSSRFTPYLKKVFKTEDGWTWSQTISRLGLEPGESTIGFSFRSGGLPTVGKCYARGYTEGLNSTEDIPEELMDAIDRASWNLPHGYTIIPGPPSDKLSLQVIVENMHRALDVAGQEGWFANGYDSKNLRTLIVTLGRAVGSDRRGEALRIAKQTTLLADAAGAHRLITSELRGLMTYNLKALEQEISSGSQH